MDMNNSFVNWTLRNVVINLH